MSRPVDSPPVPELPPLGQVVFRQAISSAGRIIRHRLHHPEFVVQKFAGNLNHPRWLLVLPNGDTLVSQARTETLGGMSPDVIEALTRQGVLGASPNNIILLRQTDTGLMRRNISRGSSSTIRHGTF